MGPPGCGKTHFAKKYFISYLDSHKSTIFRICTWNKSFKTSRPSKMRTDKILETLGLKKKNLKSLPNNKSMKPKRKSGRNCQSNYVLIFFMQVNRFLLLTQKKLTWDFLTNWFTSASSGDFPRMTVLTEATFWMGILKNTKMLSNFSWTSLICHKENSLMKIPKKCSNKVWPLQSSSSLNSQIKTFFKTFNVFLSNKSPEHISHKNRPNEDSNCIGLSWIHKPATKSWLTSSHNTKFKPT